jgi:hypothetical protein
VISGMLGGPNSQGPLIRPVDSVALVQGAVSLWCYAVSIPFQNAGPGYFSRTLAERKVTGPLVTTRSRFDNAVGRFYPLASRLRGSASFAADLPEFGVVGAYGLQGVGDQIQKDSCMLPAMAPTASSRPRSTTWKRPSTSAMVTELAVPIATSRAPN